ncbi:hypothetical protein VNO80_26735 [Phaseolus coccineus]|uniref:Uncharacterized protein n=1 Tax=Phaseolus coccineus TaxID=3886 RepID=A0AAN9LFK4_PHACN
MALDPFPFSILYGDSNASSSVHRKATSVYSHVEGSARANQPARSGLCDVTYNSLVVLVSELNFVITFSPLLYMEEMRMDTCNHFYLARFPFIQSLLPYHMRHCKPQPPLPSSLSCIGSGSLVVQQNDNSKQRHDSGHLLREMRSDSVSQVQRIKRPDILPTNKVC